VLARAAIIRSGGCEHPPYACARLRAVRMEKAGDTIAGFMRSAEVSDFSVRT
jgi:hypothetical protein